ncbi:MAG: molybdopterin-dependent oxidoreductase [Candidatus Methylomirabilales bacterium]
MSKVTRRAFLRLMGASGAYVVYGCSKYPGPRSANAVPPGWSRGEERYIPSTCLQCPSGCGIVVRVYEGRAVKIDGNPEHPLNRGRLCPKGQAGLQVLYDPDRIRGPMRRIDGRHSRKYQRISWHEAIEEVANKLKDLRESSQAHSVLMMGGTVPEPMNRLFSRFARAYGTPNVVETSSASDGTIRLSNECTVGIYDHLGYDLENTNYLICFGANFLEAWRPTTYLLRMYGIMRRGRPGGRAKIVIVDPRYSVGASKADEWIPIRPGTDAALALGMAHVIITEGLYDQQFVAEHCFGFEEWIETAQGEEAEPLQTIKHRGFKEVAAEYAPQQVEEITGVPSATIVRLAREFASSAPAVAAAGQGAGLHTNGLFNCMAVNALNALVGSIDARGGVIVQRKPPLAPWPQVALDEQAHITTSMARIDGAGSEDSPLAKSVHSALPDRILRGEPYPVEMALVYYTNPIFSGPDTRSYREALNKIPYIVSFSPFMDDTTEYADIILPDHTYLERLELDLISPSLGYPVLNIRQPVVEPLYDTRNTGDVLIELAQRIGGSLKKSFPWESFEACLKATISGVAALQDGSFKARNVNDFWGALKRKGVWFGGPYRFGEWQDAIPTPSGKFEFYSLTMRRRIRERAEAHRPALGEGNPGRAPAADLVHPRSDDAFMPHFEPPRFAGDSKEYPFYLNTFKTMMHAEGRGGNQPWLQESFGVQLTMCWEPWLSINPESARKLGMRDGDMVWIESPAGRINIRAKLHPGMPPDVVSIPFEYGHRAYGRWASKIRGNPNRLASSGMFERLSGFSALYATRVKVYKG